MLSRQLQADLWLALVTLIWGSTFVVVKNELANIGPLAFVALRFTFAFLFMALLMRRSLARIGRHQLAAGALIGVFLFGGYALQTVGLRYTTASKAAFITGLCVVLAPLFAHLLLGHTPSLIATLGVVLATAGLALLSLVDDLSLAMGDLLVLGCAASFALHIVSISRFAPRMDPVALTTVQIGVVAVGGAIATAILEPNPLPLKPGSVVVAAGMGLFATALAFTIQNRVQVFTTPTHTALVLSLEPVFGAIFAYLLAGERLGPREILGCSLILAGMVAAEFKREKGVEVAKAELATEMTSPRGRPEPSP
ncbi:MAG: DMT family transporter [Sphingomonadaceae bacterium]